MVDTVACARYNRRESHRYAVKQRLTLFYGETESRRRLWHAGQGPNRGSRVNELVLTSEAEAQDALRSLQDGQTLSLQAAVVRLNATVTLTSSNIVIRASSDRTRIFCPSAGGAFVIKCLHSQEFGSSLTLLFSIVGVQM